MQTPTAIDSADQHHEVVRSLLDDVSSNLTLLGDPQTNWQPTDMLPDLSGEDWPDQLRELRERAAAISDELLVVLVGDMITEEALPNYTMEFSALGRRVPGVSDDPWAVWLRGWAAEENRHGDLLNAYLRFGGRVDMKAIETTIQHLLYRGFSAHTGGDPYGGLIYTSFQERATRVSHRNVGALAASQGDPMLARMCRRIAADETRHETFYTRMMGRVLDEDPQGGMLSIRTMFRGLISMPGEKMLDGRDPDLFDHFATVAQRIGVYTVYDYASIMEHLIRAWDIAGRNVTGDAARAQNYICNLPQKYTRLAENYAERLVAQPPMPFSWIHDRRV